MRRVLVLGASGMLGHKMAQVLSEKYEVWAAVRSDRQALAATGIVPPDRIIPHTSAEQWGSIVQAFKVSQPDVVINCVGLVKQLAAAKAAIPSLEINALLPHRLAALVETVGARLVHVSTDCVFSGKRGGYREEDLPDAEDLYGRSKFLGELSDQKNVVTLRTSIIGRALHGTEGLVEWFLTQKGKSVRGYTEAIFSGVTTRTLAEVVRDVVIPNEGLYGLYQVAVAPICKADLLSRLCKLMDLPIEIILDSGVRCNRSLNADRFCQATGWCPPEWDAMLTVLAQESGQYEIWRKDYAIGK